MTIQDVEKYLLKVGASKYRDESVMKEFPDFNSISHFGIGILTCFMVANDIDIITNSEEQNEANCINLRKVNGSYLLKKIKKEELDIRIQKHGTMVKLYVRNDVDMSKVEEDLRKWIVLPEIPVYYMENEKASVQIGFQSPREVLTKYLNDIGCNVDGEKYDVYEKTHGNVTVAYAIRHLKYLSDWCLMGIDSRRLSKRVVLPIGTCIEGIRVEFSTPGYRNSSILAIANITNSKYQTNVARSAIELDANNEILSAIYGIFKEYVQEQMDSLEKQDYSKSWALSEGKYLMRPLVYDEYSNNRVEPVDEEILTSKLAELKCMVVEDAGKREIVSAKQVFEMDEVNIFECKMVQAAEYLLREIRSEATLNGLIEVVCSENNFLADIRNVVCNYETSNMLHQYALKNKEVSKISVGRKQRRIQLTYSIKRARWHEIDIRRGVGGTLFVPQEEFLMSGLEDEIGIKTYGGIYLRSDTELCQYIIKVINIFLEDNTDENRVLLEVFLSNIFDSNILERTFTQDVNADNMFKQMLEDRFYRVSDELLKKMWLKVDMDEFAKMILAKNYTLYSIHNWSRKDEEM